MPVSPIDDARTGFVFKDEKREFWQQYIDY